MDNFIVSARKYRPATFDTVVGQQSITNTLKNAIRNNQLAQAFLFCGPRGVGKTTCARILAKTINCEHPNANIEPCNECTSCRTFNESSSFNIHELDAASNNSVDDIRSLVEQVRIPPQMGRYKVYIIDEVHMLSAQAFNAFLKTLEEPPAYAKFILATTEKHKIIPTILSRCQIFDFKRITLDDIARHLAYVAEQEGAEADPEALHIIAQKADGALRDALSIFDQMANIGNMKISRELVIENLNILDYDYYFRITDHMLAGNFRDTLLVLNEVIDKGFDGQHFITGLGEHLRNLLMCMDAATVKLIETGETVREKYLIQARNAPVLFLINTLEINNKCDINYRASNNKRLTLEVALIQMCQVGNPVAPPTPTAAQAATITAPAQSATAFIPPPAPQTAPPKPPEDIRLPEVSSRTETSQPVAAEKAEPAQSVVSSDVTAEKPIAIPTEKPSEENPPAIVHTELLEKFPSTSMHSIRDLMSQGAQIIPRVNEAQPAILRDEDFSQEQLEAAFLKFAEARKEGSGMLFTALTSHKPEKKEGYLISITVDNSILLKELNESWTEMQGFLKDELKNDLIKMESAVTTQPVENKRFLNDKDKLDAMKSKNPQLTNLMDQLNLELDTL